MHTKEALSAAFEKSILNLLRGKASGFGRAAINSHGLLGAGIGAGAGGVNAAMHQFSGDYDGMTPREKLNAYLGNMAGGGLAGGGIGALHGIGAGNRLKDTFAKAHLEKLRPQLKQLAHGGDAAILDDVQSLMGNTHAKDVFKGRTDLAGQLEKHLAGDAGVGEALHKLHVPPPLPKVSPTVPDYGKEIQELIGLRSLQNGLTKKQYQKLADLLHKQMGAGSTAKPTAAAVESALASAAPAAEDSVAAARRKVEAILATEKGRAAGFNARKTKANMERQTSVIPENARKYETYAPEVDPTTADGINKKLQQAAASTDLSGVSELEPSAFARGLGGPALFNPHNKITPTKGDSAIEALYKNAPTPATPSPVSLPVPVPAPALTQQQILARAVEALKSQRVAPPSAATTHQGFKRLTSAPTTPPQVTGRGLMKNIPGVGWVKNS